MTRFVSTLLVCVGAVVFASTAPLPDDASISPRSNGCGLAAPASGHAALTGGALSPLPPDSTDDDDDDDGDELPTGSMVLPGRPAAAALLHVEFVAHDNAPAVRSSTVDSHSLRAPPQ